MSYITFQESRWKFSSFWFTSSSSLLTTWIHSKVCWTKEKLRIFKQNTCSSYTGRFSQFYFLFFFIYSILQEFHLTHIHDTFMTYSWYIRDNMFFRYLTEMFGRDGGRMKLSQIMGCLVELRQLCERSKSEEEEQTRGQRSGQGGSSSS